MMTKWMILGVLILLIGCNAPKKNDFVIKGTVSSYPADILILAYMIDGDFVLDTIGIDNGKLSYKKEFTDTVVASVVSRDENNNIKLGRGVIPGESITVFITPGTVLNLNLDNQCWPEIQMTGDQLNNDLMILYAKTMPLKKEAFDILRQMQNQGLSEEEKKGLEEKRSALRERIEKETIQFVKEHPDSYAALYTLSGLRNSMTLKEYIAIFNRTNAQLQQTTLGKQIAQQIQIALSSAVGAMAPDFKKKDKEGNTVQLSDYKGKYLLLDFWGSWCGPCRASHPHLKELQAHYGPLGLEVVNIAQENSANARETWLKAVEEDQMTWTQILNNEGREVCDVVKLYGITAFPTKVLIDPEGKIIVKAVGNSESIDAKLKEVFGK